MADEATEQQNPSETAESGTDTTTETQSKTETTVDDLQAALKDLGLTPGQIKARLEAGKKWESRSKENATKAAQYDKVSAELEKVRQANLSESEKALEKTRAEAHATGVAEARATYGSQLVQAKFEGMLQGRGVTADRAAILAEHLSTAAYLADDGTVDTKALTAYVDAVAPKQDESQNGLNPAAFGAGQRSATGSGLGAAGVAEAQRRFGTKQSA